MSKYDNPYDEAGDPSQPSNQDYMTFGEISLDAWFCVLQKDIGKVPFDDQINKLEDRRTNVDIFVHPLDEMNLKRALERHLLTSSNAWAKITWPSLQRLGVQNPKEAKNKFCKVKLSPTGRKYENKNGEKVDETSFEFLALYNTVDECRQAYLADNGNKTESQPVQENPERAKALKFAAAIVKNAKTAAGNDESALRSIVSEKLASMGATSKYFSVESPEIEELILEQLL